MRRTRRVVLACILVVVASWKGLIARSKFSMPVGIPYREDSAMEKFRDDPPYGAAERVHAYIADAYVWETNAMPRNPELELKLRSELESRLSGRTNQQNLPMEALQARGRALLNSRKDHLQALKDLAAIHWIGDAWKEEASLLSNPPKHDPDKELIINLKLNEDGSVDVTTETMAETRVYRVELIEGKWLIRKYAWHSNSQ